MTPLQERARTAAHKATPRCTGGTGHGPGGDGSRWHSDRCEALAEVIHQFALAEIEHADHEAAANIAPGKSRRVMQDAQIAVEALDRRKLHAEAEAIRTMLRTYRASRELNSRLYNDNAALRAVVRRPGKGGSNGQDPRP